MGDRNKRLFDKEFDNGTNIKLENLNESQIRNLNKLCKVWGIVKYHHELKSYFVDFECAGNSGLSKGENIKRIIEKHTPKSPILCRRYTRRL